MKDIIYALDDLKLDSKLYYLFTSLCMDLPEVKGPFPLDIIPITVLVDTDYEKELYILGSNVEKLWEIGVLCKFNDENNGGKPHFLIRCLHKNICPLNESCTGCETKNDVTHKWKLIKKPEREPIPYISPTRMVKPRR